MTYLLMQSIGSSNNQANSSHYIDPQMLLSTVHVEYNTRKRVFDPFSDRNWRQTSDVIEEKKFWCELCKFSDSPFEFLMRK